MSFPSTFLDLQNGVIAKVGADSTLDLQRVKDWLNIVYAQVCIECEANELTATMALTAGVSGYTLPAGLQRIKSMYVTPVGGQRTNPLTQISVEEMISRQAGATGSRGYVSHFALSGIDVFDVWQTPSGADSLALYYDALPTALSANGDVPILHEPFSSQCLMYGALAEAADFLSDPKEQEYRQLFQDWTNRYRAWLTGRRGTVSPQMEVAGSLVFPPHDRSTDLGF